MNFSHEFNVVFFPWKMFVTTSFLRSPGLLKVFSLILTVESSLSLVFTSPPHLMFYCFFCSLARSRYLWYFSFYFIFTQWFNGMAKFTSQPVLFFLIDSWSSHLNVLSKKSRRILCWQVRPPPNECPRYDTKQSESEVPIILELCGILSTSLLPSLWGLLWPGVVAPDRVLSMGPIELNSVHILNWIAWNRIIFDISTAYLWLLWIELFWHLKCVLVLNWFIWNRTFYMYKNGFGINNLQWLMCHKTKPSYIICQHCQTYDIIINLIII